MGLIKIMFKLGLVEESNYFALCELVIERTYGKGFFLVRREY